MPATCPASTFRRFYSCSLDGDDGESGTGKRSDRRAEIELSDRLFGEPLFPGLGAIPSLGCQVMTGIQLAERSNRRGRNEQRPLARHGPSLVTKLPHAQHLRASDVVGASLWPRVKEISEVPTGVGDVDRLKRQVRCAWEHPEAEEAIDQVVELRDPLHSPGTSGLLDDLFGGPLRLVVGGGHPVDANDRNVENVLSPGRDRGVVNVPCAVDLGRLDITYVAT